MKSETVLRPILCSFRQSSKTTFPHQSGLSLDASVLPFSRFYFPAQTAFCCPGMGGKGGGGKGGRRCIRRRHTARCFGVIRAHISALRKNRSCSSGDRVANRIKARKQASRSAGGSRSRDCWSWISRFRNGPSICCSMVKRSRGDSSNSLRNCANASLRRSNGSRFHRSRYWR